MSRSRISSESDGSPINATRRDRGPQRIRTGTLRNGSAAMTPGSWRNSNIAAGEVGSTSATLAS
jgi:hypothetical protein